MLKISTTDSQRRRYLVVEGKLIEPWTGELRDACEKARADLGVRELIVDLRSLTLISEEGEEVLLQIMGNGLKILPHGVFARQIVKQVALRLCAAVKGDRS
jgi:anti-anti-sigma regulatory factor